MSMKKVAFSIPKELKRDVEEQADREHRNFSNMVRYALIEYLKENRDDYEAPD